jgi:hypothetical protein
MQCREKMYMLWRRLVVDDPIFTNAIVYSKIAFQTTYASAAILFSLFFRVTLSVSHITVYVLNISYNPNLTPIQALSAHSAAEFNISSGGWQHVLLVAIVPPERRGKWTEMTATLGEL